MQQFLIPLIFASLITGCSTLPAETLPPDPAEKDPALFCDVEEKRRFTEEEIAWRSKNAPWNLARDFRTNLSWERWCEEQMAR